MIFFKSKEKRQSIRIATHSPIKFKAIYKSSQEEALGGYCKAYSRNISTGGIAVEAPKPRLDKFFKLASKRMGFELNLPEAPVIISGMVELVWTKSISDKKEKMGLRFIKIEVVQKNKLAQYIFEKTELKKKPFKRLKNSIEDFVYNRIVKPLFFTSRLGRKTMFGYADSGINFDHIYKNEAKGYTRFGKLVDKMLLNFPACKATRNRKERMIEILKKEVEENISRGKKTRIVDLASGPARYLVELITKDIEKNVEALCLDINPQSLRYGKKIAGGRPILYKKSNVLRLGPHHLRLSEKKGWRPNIVAASGLYEYINDDLSRHTLRMVKNSLEPGGLLLLITQQANPNKKLIEKIGVTKSGKKWILFYRKPQIIRKWLEDLGYKDIEIEIDPWKMYVFYKARVF